MAITITTPSPSKFGFILNAISDDISGAEILKAAPAAGLSIIVDHITINAKDAVTITIGEGITGGGVTTALIGPLSMGANSSIQWNFTKGFAVRGMSLSEATALTVDASGAGAICVFVIGRVE